MDFIVRFLSLIKLSMIWFLVITTFSFPCAERYVFASDQNNILSSSSLASASYKWIVREKIRSGYLYFTDPVSKIDLVKDLGLNTVIVGCYGFEYANLRQDAIYKMKEWAKIARSKNIHLFFAINWQPYPRPSGHKYPLVVYEDGTEGVAVCPLDKKFWDERINDIFILIADMSNEPDLQVDGIYLDMEIYGAENEPLVRRSYYESKGDYSDTCFFKYLVYIGYTFDAFPVVELKDRKNWLANKMLLDDYYVFLRRLTRNQAEKLREAVHQINPNLLLGMYPHPTKDNFIQYPLAKGFSSQRLPLVVFGVHSYGSNIDEHGDGYTRIPKDVKARYQKDGINILYLAGYLFRKYDGKSLERNLKHSVNNWDGYWLFNLQQLWKIDDDADKSFQLKDSIENLKKATSRSNNMGN